MINQLKFGDTIRMNNTNLTFLDIAMGGGLLCVTTNPWRKLPFDDVRNPHNNWATSTLRQNCNEEFLPLLDKRLLLPQISDLTADNGDDSYGQTTDMITLLTCDQMV